MKTKPTKPTPSKTGLCATLPVRLDAEVQGKLDLIAKQTSLTRSAVMRLAINHGLPMLEAGRIKITRQPVSA